MAIALSSSARVAEFYAALKSRKSAIESRYRALTPRSGRLFLEAQQVFPGGFTRDAILRKPYAPFIDAGLGTRLVDVDGREIVDFWFNATSLPLGHRHPLVVGAVQAQLSKGTAFFAPGELEIEHARLILERLPSFDRLRFTNSGSEAVMLALRIARGYTGRNLVAKFEGSYHGSYDDVSWSVGAGADKMGLIDNPTPVAESAGLPAALGRSVVLPFNDLPRAKSLIERHAQDLAAVIVEPMANRMGLILPDPSFAQGLRELCTRYGIQLIFDEVISFRLSHGGAQGVLGIKPDMTTLGKIIGGGFPVGAVLGRAEVMATSDPFKAGRVTHAGTFNANPMTMAAGIATMRALTAETFETMAVRGERVRSGLRKICGDYPLQVSGAGSLFKVTALDRPIRSYRDSVHADREWEEIASLELLNRGYLLTTQLQGCVSAITEDGEIDGLLDAMREIVAL
jgi:glutamate-1-semialdehyde 2,1-aminomutase